MLWVEGGGKPFHSVYIGEEMIEVHKKDKEVDITIKYSEPVGEKPRIDILGTGDCGHHLIEGVFDLLDKLARMEKVGHKSEEWRKR